MTLLERQNCGEQKLGVKEVLTEGGYTIVFCRMVELFNILFGGGGGYMNNV